jgi:hypothetical protein
MYIVDYSDPNDVLQMIFTAIENSIGYVVGMSDKRINKGEVDVGKVAFVAKMDEWYIFKALIYVSAGTDSAQCEYKPSRNIYAIGLLAEECLATCMAKTTNTTNFDKKILIIDLAAFPVISARIDSRCPYVPNSADKQFQADIISEFNKHREKAFLTVMVNLNIPFTTLKEVIVRT